MCAPQVLGFGLVVHVHTFLGLVKPHFPGPFSSAHTPTLTVPWGLPLCCSPWGTGLVFSLERPQALDFLDFICPNLLPPKVVFLVFFCGILPHPFPTGVAHFNLAVLFPFCMLPLAAVLYESQLERKLQKLHVPTTLYLAGWRSLKTKTTRK